MTIKQAKKLTHNVVDGAGELAKRVGSAAQDLAESIGPKRGLIGLAVIGVAVGGSLLARRIVGARRDSAANTGLDQGVRPASKSGKNKLRSNGLAAHAH